MAHLKCVSRLNLNKNSLSIFVLPFRSIWYKPNNKGLTKKRKRDRIPFNWRQVNFNPAKIPSAWKPLDYDEKNKIDPEYEKKKAEYIPGYEPKLLPTERSDYHEEPAYVVDDKTNFYYGMNQVMFLTKCVRKNDLPQSITDLSDNLWSEEQSSKALEIMERAHLFDIDPKNLIKTKNYNYYLQDNRYIYSSSDRICNLMSWEFMRLSQSRGIQMNLFDWMKRQTTEDLSFTTSFNRANTVSSKIKLAGLYDSWITQIQASSPIQSFSKKPLKQFACEDEVEQTKLSKLEDIYPITPISDVTETNFYDLVNETGLSAGCDWPYLHTMVVYGKPENEPYKLHCLMYQNLFAALNSRAVSFYGNEPKVLPQPLTAQCIGLDGRNFTFMCLQLNTTDFSDDNGIKNQVWQSPDIPLFDKCSQTHWHCEDYHSGFDPKAFKLFQAIWLNNNYV